MRMTWNPTAGAAGWPRLPITREILLALGLGCVLALAILLFPVNLALTAGLAAWIATLALIDVRVFVLALIVVRSSLDIAAELSLVQTGLLGDLNVAAVLSGMLIALGLVHFAANRINISKTPLFWPFSAFIAAYTVGVLYAPDPGVALHSWLRIFSVFILYLLVVDMLRDQKRAGTLVQAIMLSAVLPVLVGLFQIVTGSGNQFVEGFNRITATFVHPNPYAIYLVTLLPIAAVVFLHTRSKWGKVGLGLLIAGLLINLLLTFTRIAWLGLIVALVIMVAVNRRWGLVAAIAALALLIWIAVPGVQERIAQASGEHSGLSWRLQQWEDALSLQSPLRSLTGAGPGAVRADLGNSTHNDYLRLWIEGGILVSVAFLWLYGSLLRTAIAAYRGLYSGYERSFVLAFIGVFAAWAVMATTDNLIAHPAVEWYFWALAALTVALGTQSKAAERQSAKGLLAKGFGR